MINYFDIPALSNSEMGYLRKEIYGIDDIGNLDYHFAFGTLVDAMLTETSREVEQARQAYSFDQKDLKNADIMVRNCKLDPLIKLMLPVAVGQYVYVRTLTIAGPDFEFKVKCKCKYDLLIKKYSTGLDFKTLSVSDYKSFIASIKHFDYDRQAAFYMDIAGINRFWIVAISKKNSKVFKLAIERGDENYLSGLAKYRFWAHKYSILIEPLTF